MKKRVREILTISKEDVVNYDNKVNFFEKKINDFVKNSSDVNQVDRDSENDIDLLNKIISVTNDEFLYRKKLRGGEISPFTKMLINYEILNIKRTKREYFINKYKLNKTRNFFRKIFSEVKDWYLQIKEYYIIKRYERNLNLNLKDRRVSFSIAKKIKRACELQKRVDALYK